jgi:hypothetical protein
MSSSTGRPGDAVPPEEAVTREPPVEPGVPTRGDTDVPAAEQTPNDPPPDPYDEPPTVP